MARLVPMVDYPVVVGGYQAQSVALGLAKGQALLVAQMAMVSQALEVGLVPVVGREEAEGYQAAVVALVESAAMAETVLMAVKGRG